MDGKASLQNIKKQIGEVKTNNAFMKSKGETERNGKAIFPILSGYQFNTFMYMKQFT